MRNHFLKLAFLGLLVGLPQGVGSFVSLKAMGDGWISLHNVNLREEVEVQYRNSARKYDAEALETINHLLRCRSDQQQTQMALPLIELVDHLQDHFGVEVVEVVSGYRSPPFNAYLKRIGRRVASQSRHMLGQAMDIRLPGVDMRRVRDYLIALRIGGVGYYGRNRFVHVDVGPFRTW